MLQTMELRAGRRAVVNLSLGGSEDDTFNEGVNQLNNAGAAVVVAAGTS